VEAGYKVRKPAALLAWLQAYGAATATNMSYEKIRGIARSGEESIVNKQTAGVHIEVLKELRILDEVPAWLPGQNFLAVRALGLNAKKLLLGEEGPIGLQDQGW
jgi:hypothetical protein